MVCELQILLFIHQKIFARSIATKNVELAIDYFPGIRIAAPGNPVDDAVRTKTTILRRELGGLFNKHCLVFVANEPICCAFVRGLDIGLAASVFAEREVGNRIMTLQHQDAIDTIGSAVIRAG